MIIQRLQLLLLAVAVGFSARADLVEPDHILYGEIAIAGQPVADGTVISLLLAASGEQLVSYRKGDDPNLGDFYALRVPMDSGEPRLASRARPGDEAIILVNGEQAAQAIIGEYGQTQRLDVDPSDLDGFAQLTADDVTLDEGHEGTSFVELELVLSRASQAEVTVDWTTVDGTAVGGVCPGDDYAAAAGTAVIPADTTTTSITIDVCGDLEVEDDESFQVQFSNVSGAELETQMATVGIDNDDFDALDVIITPPVVLEPDGGSSLAIFDVSLMTPAPQPILLTWSTRDGTAQAGADYVAGSDTLTIPTGETSGSIAVSVLADGNVEPNENFFLVVDALQGGQASATEFAALIVDRAFDQDRPPEQDLVDGQDGAEGLSGASALTMAADDRALFVAGTSDQAVVQLQRDVTTGLLSYGHIADVNTLGVSFNGVSDVASGPDQRFAFYVIRDSGRAQALRVDTSGVQSMVTAPGGGSAPASMSGAVSATVDPAGHHLYVAAEQAHAVNVHAIDPQTGALTWLEAEINGEDDLDDSGPAVSDLLGPRAITISADGQFVYVAARLSSAIAIFRRETSLVSTSYGRLEYLGSFQSGPGDAVMMGGPRAMVISTDSRHLYVVGETSASLVVLDRRSDGTLAFRAGYRGFALPSAVAMSPTDVQVAVTDFSGDAIHTFDRLADGSLLVGDVRRNGEPGIDSLDGPADLVYSRDDKFVYVASSGSNSVSVFKRFASEQMFRSGFE